MLPFQIVATWYQNWLRFFEGAPGLLWSTSLYFPPDPCFSELIASCPERMPRSKKCQSDLSGRNCEGQSKESLVWENREKKWPNNDTQGCVFLAGWYTLHMFREVISYKVHIRGVANQVWVDSILFLVWFSCHVDSVFYSEHIFQLQCSPIFVMCGQAAATSGHNKIKTQWIRQHALPTVVNGNNCTIYALHIVMHTSGNSAHFRISHAFV